MPRQQLKTEEKVTEKRARVPVHESRDRLTVRGLDHANFVYRFSDMGNADKIQQRLDAGYVFVNKGGSNVGDSTLENIASPDSLITVSGGAGKKLVLMAIPREFYEEDLKSKDAKIKELERAMRRDLASKADPNAAINYGEADFGSKVGFDTK